VKRVLWCISVFFIGSLLRAAPINETTPDPIFKNDSLFKSAYTFKKSYSIIYLNSEILKTSKEVSEMLLADPGGVGSGLKLWLKADAGVSLDINTNAGRGCGCKAAVYTIIIHCYHYIICNTATV